MRTWLLVLLVACSGTRGAREPDPAPEAPPPPDPTANWIGAWSSPSCGVRPFERRIVFEAGGTVRGEERISPCPPDASCVWSGIVPWTGTWTLAGDTITIAVKGELEPRATQKPPETLTWKDAPVEMVGAEACPYEPFSGEVGQPASKEPSLK